MTRSTRITIAREHTISCGHRVAWHEGKCANFHGHNYAITTYLEPLERLDKLGRVLDFTLMKECFDGWLEANWDHKFLLWKDDPLLTGKEPDGQFFPMAEEALTQHIPGIVLVPFNPTAENMALYLLSEVFSALIAHVPVRVLSVKIFETPKCSVVAACA